MELRCSATPEQIEEGDGSCRRLLLPLFSCNTKKKKKATATLLPSPSSWSCGTPQQEEEGDGSYRHLLLPLSLALHKEEEEGIVAIAFFFFFFSCNTKSCFVELRCSVTSSCAA